MLPGSLPPDQLIFEFLYNLPPDDAYWKNRSGFTKPVFLSLCQKVSDTLKIDPADDKIDLAKLVSEHGKTSGPDDQRLRSHFKLFANNEKFLRMVSGGTANNPYRAWAKHHPELCEDFRESLRKGLRNTMISGFGIDSAMLKALDGPEDLKNLKSKVPE